MSDQSLELPAQSTTAPAAADEPASSSPAPAVEPATEPATSALVLEAPAPVRAVAPTQAAGAVPISAADEAMLDEKVAAYVDAILSLDPHSPAFADKVDELGKLGDEDIRSSASVSSRLLDKPLAAVENSRLSEASAVSTSLRNLRRQVEELDPAKQGDLLSPHKLLGLLPFGAGDRLRNYFDKYRGSQHQIDAIIKALYHGQDELRRDNAAIDQEKVNLWAVMGRLRQYAYLAQAIDTALAARIAAVEPTDPERATILKEDMLFSARQKNQDLLTQLAVSVQGYLALDVIRRNNLELIKGVQRATTTTVSALRTAVIVAQALADQKLVLDQITALNTTTSNLIESTSELLHQQSGAVSAQAASATVDLAKLQAAFANIYATIDEIDTFKVAALDSMQQTVSALSTEVATAQAHLDRAHDREGRDSGLDALGTDKR